MAVNFTSAQTAAIESRKSTLVSAAAGSGKTAVLVERVISKIAPADENKTPPVPADRLLIVTFTNAAAAEMRGRIERALYEKIKENPQKEYLQKQKHLFSCADISTIDSFCARLVRENFSRFDVSPDFAVCKGIELTEKRGEMLDGILKPYFEENSAAFQTALELTDCEYDEKNLCALVENLFDEAMLRPFPDEYLKQISAPYNAPFRPGHAWYDGIMQTAAQKIALCVRDAEVFCENAAMAGCNTEKFISYGEILSGVINTLENVCRTGDYDYMREMLSQTSFASIPGTSNKDKDKYIIAAGELKTRIKERIDGLREFFLYPSAQIEEFRLRAAPAVETIMNICREYKEKYFELCREENMLTFAFCEQLVFNLLCKLENGRAVITDAAGALAEKYDEVMVDEYQDVNNLQDAIFTVISGNGKKLFVVGDVKQSIYGFRGSNPDNFLKKEAKASTDDKKSKIFLSENFRSRKGVCEAANYLFSLLFAGQTGGIVYGEDEKLKPAAKFPDMSSPAARLLIVDNSQKAKLRIDTEGEAIADFIEKTIAGEAIIKVDENTLRKAKYDDFTILLRSVSGEKKAQPIADALAKHGIPVSYTGESYFEAFEIKLLTALVKIIDNPKCDVEMLTVMMSPLFGLTAQDMAEIRIASGKENRKESLYSSVIKAAESGNEKCRAFVETLGEYRRIFSVNTLGDAVNRLMSLTGIADIVSVMPGGDVKLANLQLFSKLVYEYSNKYTGGIYGFLHYAENLPEKAFKTEESGKGGVRIMSMHKSKGLQFPICILANLTGKTNKSDSTDAILKNEKYGIGFKYFDEQAGVVQKTVNHRLLADFAIEKTVNEELRLLYVAATRAQDVLCMVCSLDNPSSKIDTLCSRLSDTPPYITKELLTKSVSIADWVLSCALLGGSGRDICERFDVEAFPVNTGYNLAYNVFTAEGLSDPAGEEAAGEKPETDAALVEKMKRNFAYVYPFEKLSRVEAKVSVSRLANGREAERFAFTAKPSFMLEGGLSAAQAGTAMHHVMQYISFEDGISVEDEIDRLREWRYISEAEALSVDAGAIKKFFESDIFAEIKRSPDVRREMRFLTGVPVGEIDPSAAGVDRDARVLVQGAVDLCFERDGKITVLDFKTDKVDNLETLKERYREQLEIYSKACEKTFAKPVDRRIVYSFCLSDYIVF